jgi:phosphoribosylaminoimidazole-succinocarboxamide synthase
MIEKVKLLAKGKAKDMYTSTDPNALVMVFRDDISAFNAEKVATLTGKGAVNQAINASLMQYLESKGIKTHFIRSLNERECLVHKLDMLPVECVIRNISAGSYAKRFGIETGKELGSSIFELFYKNDALGDPMIRDEHAIYFGWATEQDIAQMKHLSFRINALLSEYFHEHGLTLVDFKLEFGRLNGELVLADEISPDGCRIWDSSTQTILDKDRFRKDLGDVVEGYQKVAKKLHIPSNLFE